MGILPVIEKYFPSTGPQEEIPILLPTPFFPNKTIEKALPV